MDKEDILKAISDWEDEERKWMENMHIQRMMMLGQIMRAGRKSELGENV